MTCRLKKSKDPHNSFLIERKKVKSLTLLYHHSWWKLATLYVNLYISVLVMLESCWKWWGFSLNAFEGHHPAPLFPVMLLYTIPSLYLPTPAKDWWGCPGARPYPGEENTTKSHFSIKLDIPKRLANNNPALPGNNGQRPESCNAWEGRAEEDNNKDIALLDVSVCVNYMWSIITL